MADEQEDHISRIETMWTLVFQAHGPDSELARNAQSVMMQRYSHAIYRYLLKITGNAHDADEVFQQFALNFVQGGFHKANPDGGRFRNYLKVVIARLVAKFRRGQGRLVNANEDALENLEAEVIDDQQLNACLRDEVLRRTWIALEQEEQETGSPYFTVLDFRAKNPEAGSDAAAVALTESMGLETPWSAAALRKSLQRARKRFSELLRDEVQQMLGANSSEDAVQQELAELGLLRWSSGR